MLRSMDRRQFLALGGTALTGLWPVRFAKGIAGLPEDHPLSRLLRVFNSEEQRRRPIGDRMDRIGASLLGTPYVAHTLETSDTVEICTVNLAGLDCVTFFESCLAIARMVGLRQTSEADLIRQVTLMRYRGGMLDGYVSRLHYTSEWIADNVKKGIVRDITQDLPGAVRFEKKIHFMSSNPKSYRQLKGNPNLVSKIAEIERRLSSAAMFHVPKDQIADAEPHLQTGDIVGITTSIEGIDCSHTGMCSRDTDGRLRFCHASSSEKKVVLGPRLSAYVGSVSRNLGVMIARPLEPKPR